MAASVFDSPLFARLFPVGAAGRLFTDSAELRAMMLVEGTLARHQGKLGLIPAESGEAIHRAAMEIQIDPSGLADPTGQNGVCVPGLVAAFRKEMEAPEHAQFVHFGATSQDIIDTGLMLRLRQFLNLQEDALRAALSGLADLAETHADLPMAGRTYGQQATPTSFGNAVALWGGALLGLLQELDELRASCLLISLAGAAGTAAELGPQAPELRAAMARALGLNDPGRNWHSDRQPILRLTGWMSRLCTAWGKMAEDLVLMAQTEIGEIKLPSAGGSSTMPQKQNPVQPSAILALARQVNGMNSVLQNAGMHRQDRDGAAWFTEWLTLPQLCLGTAACTQIGQALATGLAPYRDAMARNLALSNGLIHAEALSFRLAQTQPRPEAQAATKALCKTANETGQPLATLATQAYPDLQIADIFSPAQQMGHAPAQARAFAQQIRNLPAIQT